MFENLKEKGEYELTRDRITVGVATCGVSAGALNVVEELRKANLGVIQDTGCAGMCYAEPIVTLYRNGNKYIYGNVNPEAIQEFIALIRKGELRNKFFLANEYEELDFYKKQNKY